MPFMTESDKKHRKIAFVIIDMQKKFTGGSIKDAEIGGIVETINKTAEMFRRNGRAVIFVHYDGPSHSSVYGKEDGDSYLQNMVTDPKDITVHKKHMNSFLNSRLADAVKECGCDSVLLCGMVTQFCVLGTYYGAFDHGLSPYLLKGGIIATDEKYNDAACVMCKTFTIEDAEENLRTTEMPVPATLGYDYPRCDTEV